MSLLPINRWGIATLKLIKNGRYWFDFIRPLKPYKVEYNTLILSPFTATALAAAQVR